MFSIHRKVFKEQALIVMKQLSVKPTHIKNFELINDKTDGRIVKVELKSFKKKYEVIELIDNKGDLTNFIYVQDYSKKTKHFIYEGVVIDNNNNLKPRDLYKNLIAMEEENMDCNECEIKDECPIKPIKELFKSLGKL